jgi:hypothetical protein
MPKVCPDSRIEPCSMRLAASVRSDSLTMLYRSGMGYLDVNAVLTFQQSF